MFNKVLIANRGEIAVRIIRACREMGIATVAVFSDADKSALHVSLADESVCIGGARAGESYLNMSAVLSAAVATGAGAIHPGYGLLSENAKFAELCKKCGITFIGASTDTILQMGDKSNARQTMIKAGVPVIPGSNVINSQKEALEFAKSAGYPLLIKARSGGGGKGMRLVKSEAELAPQLNAAAAEAKAAFSDGAVYIEKYLSGAKHIEVQILADKHGNAVSLGERECSVQRNNQKLIEESPSVAITENVRRKLFEYAVSAAKQTGYVGAGTLEFLLCNDGNLYFMEMNTRIQVEHAVTEMLTGIDLVKWQIRIAAGFELNFSQEQVRLEGAAIECRINAENPSKNFLPSCGKIELLHLPGGPSVRFDTALYPGYSVPPYYDSLIGKLIVHAPTREEALRKMQAALCELVIEGIDHNSELLLEIIEHSDFVSGSYNTDFMKTKMLI